MADRVTIKVTGIDKAIKNLKKYQTVKKKQIKEVLMKDGFKVELAAKEHCPVKTGHLRSKITTDITQINILLVKIGTNVFYSIFVEYGTVKMSAQAFLFPAYFMYEGEIVRDIGRVLKKDIRLK